jgi:hypothetical protein
MEGTLKGDETDVSAFRGCPDGVAVELWTVQDGTHALHITPDFVPEAIGFLLTHAKP